jgi:hypothetical protein
MAGYKARDEAALTEVRHPQDGHRRSPEDAVLALHRGTLQGGGRRWRERRRTCRDCRGTALRAGAALSHGTRPPADPANCLHHTEKEPLMLRIYDFKGFPNPTRVRIALAEKGLAGRVEFVTVDVPEASTSSQHFWLGTLLAPCRCLN